MTKLFFLIPALFIMSCTSLQKKENVSTEFIGKDLEAKKYSNIYFSAQPTNMDFQALKQQGFQAVINLREPSEYDESEEKKLVKSSGMTYKNIPFSSSSVLNDEFIDEVTRVVSTQRKKGKVLVHCSSGNRVGIWAGGHFYKDHSYSKVKSLRMAKKLGAEKAESLKKVSKYVEKK